MLGFSFVPPTEMDVSSVKALALILPNGRKPWPGGVALVAGVMFLPDLASASCAYLPAEQHDDVRVYDATFVRRRGRTAALYDFEVDGAIRSFSCPICPFYPPGLDWGKRVRLAVRNERIVEMGDEGGCQADESRLAFYRLKRSAWVLGLVAVVLLFLKIYPRKR